MRGGLRTVLVLLLGAVGILVAFAIDLPGQGSSTPCAFDPATMTAPGCTLVRSDTGSSADPEPLWGTIDCAGDSRASMVTSGGDPNPMATGAMQGNGAYRRLTVVDGQASTYGWERCELGWNEWSYGSEGGNGTFQIYREGERRITFASFRLPEDFPVDSSRFQSVLQMKQTQPSDNGSCPPVLSLQVRNGEWWLQHASSPGPCGLSETLWKAPASTGVWVRVALDVTYSQHPGEGRVKLYLDRNGDGDALDADERSPTITTHTLKYETPDPAGQANDSDGLAPGDSVPSHLRVGLYHDPSIACPAPAGCSVQVDNVQVVGP